MSSETDQPQDEYPRGGGTLGMRHNTEIPAGVAFFYFSIRSGSHNQPSFFVFLCFCFLLTPSLSMNHPYTCPYYDKQEEQDVKAEGVGNNNKASGKA